MNIRLTVMEGIALLAAFAIASCNGTTSSGAGGNVALRPNVLQAIENIEARGPQWLRGMGDIYQRDRPPPAGVNFATVSCPNTVILWGTTLDSSVEHLESLLVHEAFEIQHGCKDNDQVADAFARCYQSGKSHAECLREVGYVSN